MKVYIVYSYDWDWWEIVKIFFDKDHADDYCEGLKRLPDIDNTDYWDNKYKIRQSEVE